MTVNDAIGKLRVMLGAATETVVEMETEEGAQTAIEALSGQELKGRPLKIDIARPREARPTSSF